MDHDEISRRLNSIWADACGAGLEPEFIFDVTNAAAVAALMLGVEDYSRYSDDDTDAIAETVAKKVRELLLVEVAKINGT